MAEAASREYVNTMDYFIDYYANYEGLDYLKDFDYNHFFNSNEIINHNCFIQIKIDTSCTIYFIKEGLDDTPIGAERFYDVNNQVRIATMERESRLVVTELIEGKTDLTLIYDDIIAEFVRGRSQQDSGWDNYPSPRPVEDSWGVPPSPPPLAGVVRSQPTIQYDTPEEIVFSPGMDVNRQLNFDSDDMANQIIDHIHSMNRIICPLCRTENTKDKCVDIKGSGDTCSICLDKKVEIFFIGCSHAATCRVCFERL
jgi:hypothetical protein